MKNPCSAALLGVVLVAGCHCGEPIEVVLASPEGPQATVPKVARFQLSRPLYDAAQPLPGELPSPQVRIEPALPFRASISSPLSIDVEFAAPPALAQAYSVTLEDGLRSADGQAVLKDAYAAKFSTPVNALQSIGLYDADGREVSVSFVGPDGKPATRLASLGPAEGLALSFAHALPADQLGLVKLFVRDGAQVPVTVTRDEADHRKLRIVPAQRWSRDTPLMLTIDAGLRIDGPGAGPLASEKPYAIELKTWGAQAITGPDTSKSCHGARTLPITFANPVACPRTLEHLSIDVPGTTFKCVSDAVQRVQRYEITPQPPHDRDLHVTLSAGLVDAFGETVPAQLGFTYKACEGAVQFAYTKPFVILDPGQSSEAIERVHGAKSLKITGKRVSVAEAWRVLRKEKLTDQVAWTDLPWWLQWGGDGWGEDGEAGGEPAKKPGELDGGPIDVLEGAPATVLPINGDKGWRDVAIPLAPYLGGRKGLVLLREATLSDAGAENGRSVLRLVNVTDIGLSARLSRDTLVLLAASYSTGKPLAGVKVAVSTEAGKALGEGVTGADGLLRLPVTSLKGVSGLRDEQLLLVANQGDDEAFLWTRFVVDNAYGSDEPELVGLVYTDRGIYRPGENGHLRAVLRMASAKGFTSLAGQKARLEVYDAENTQVIGNDPVISPWGSFEQALAIPKNARVGTWRYTVSVGNAHQYGSFEVGEFRRPELKVEIQAPPSLSWGEKLTAVVQGDYLFGAPAAGLDMRWTLLRRAASFESKRVPDATFATPTRDEWSWGGEGETLLAEGRHKLDDHGACKLEQPLRLPNPVAQRELVTITASVDDANGQSVSRLAQVELFSGKVLAGLAGGAYLAKQNDALTVSAVAVTTDDRLAPRTPLRILTRASGWRSVRRAGPGGGYYWTSERFEEPEVERCRGVANANGRLDCTFKPETGGSLQVIAEARDAEGRAVRAGRWHWVWGDANYWGGESDSPQVGVLAERETVDAGEPIKLALNSPFREGVALVTVEREDVLWQKAFPVGTSAQLEIPTDPAWAPNVHVIATIVRGRTPQAVPPDPDKEKPAFAIGRKVINVKPRGRRLEVKLEVAKDRLEPGQEQSAVAKVLDADGKPVKDAEVNLWAVDEGVLMLTGYHTPDLLGAMLHARGLRTIGLDTRAYVLGKRAFVEPVIKGQEDGGGGGDEADRTRKNFDPLATWVGTLVTDGQGRASHAFKVPDNLTTYRVMAVVATKDDRFGGGEGKFKVNKPLMLRQALSRFARPGDKLRVGVLVNQLTEAAGTAVVSLDAIDEKLFSVSSPRKVEVQVAPAATVPVLFDLAANDVEGASELVFSASMGTHRDKVQFKLPVVRQSPRETVAASGVIASGVFQGSLQLPPQARAESLEVNVSGFPISALEPRLREMVGYPYGCLEQKTSKILPLLAIRKLGQDLHMASIPADQIKGWVDEYISIIPKYRCDNDGFDYWPGCKFGASTILSSFALEGMLAARKFGFDVPQAEIDRTVGFLRTMVREGSEGRDQYGGDGLVDHEFVGALRVLAAAGQPELELEQARFEARAKLPLFAKTDLARAMASHLGTKAAADTKVKTLLDEIGAKGRTTADGLTFDAEDPKANWRAWESSQRNTALVLQTLAQVVPADGRIPLLVKGLVDLDDASPYYITSDTTQTLLALADAIPLLNTGAKLKTSVSAAGRKLGDETLGGAVKSWSVPGDGLSGEIPLQIANTGEGPIFFGAFLKYAYPATARLPAAANGFVLSREYFGADGKPLPVVDTPAGKVAQVRVGDFVRVRIQAKVDEDGRLVVIEDPLPAGLEAVDARLATSDTAALRKLNGDQRPSWWDEYQRELRDDRVEWHYESIWPGTMELAYVARASTAGTFYAPGAHAERMYQPAKNGRSEGIVLQVLPKAP